MNDMNAQQIGSVIGGYGSNMQEAQCARRLPPMTLLQAADATIKELEERLARAYAQKDRIMQLRIGDVDTRELRDLTNRIY